MSDTSISSTTGPVVRVAQKILALAQEFENSTDNEIYRRSQRAQLQDASDELLRAILSPSEYAILVAEAFHESSALNLVTTSNVTDLLGDQSLSAQILADKAGVKAHHLGTALSCLAAKGIFEEVNGFGSKTFKNNDYSLVLSGKQESSVESAVRFICDEGFNSATRLTDAASPTTNPAGLPAGSLAFNAPIRLFKWMALPENSWRVTRQMKSYDQLHHIANHSLEEDYEWGSLRSPLVDIGCGVASTERTLLALPQTEHLRYTLYDLQPVIENTKKSWEGAGLGDKASFVAGDFFQNDPVNIPANAPTYMLRHIFLEWQDDEALKFLKNLHTVMADDSVLLVVEVLLHEDSDRLIRTSSMHMLSLNNAVTRTVPETVLLLSKAGFQLKKLNRLLAADSILEFTKV